MYHCKVVSIKPRLFILHTCYASWGLSLYLYKWHIFANINVFIRYKPNTLLLIIFNKISWIYIIFLCLNKHKLCLKIMRLSVYFYDISNGKFLSSLNTITKDAWFTPTKPSRFYHSDLIDYHGVLQTVWQIRTYLSGICNKHANL